MIDLTPFGFTSTESLAYAALLRLGPATGYAVSREVRVARANAYAALEGLVRQGAAHRLDGRPLRYRPADPDALLALLASNHGQALERLEHSLVSARRSIEPVTREVTGARALAIVVTQLVARAERSIRGVIAADLWKPTLPAWRRAAGRASVDVRAAGPVTDDEGIIRGSVSSDSPTLLVIDDVRAVIATSDGAEAAGLWTAHPLIARTAILAIERLL
jgi:sugar-specific transcriptional regulator TrmB